MHCLFGSLQTVQCQSFLYIILLSSYVCIYVHCMRTTFLKIMPACCNFADASKACDLVRHGILFDLLVSGGLPLPVVRLI